MTELREALVLVAAAALIVSSLAVDHAAAANERPYEMEGREPAHPPLLEFEDLAGWTVAGVNGGEGSLECSREQQMWGEYVGKLTYRGSQADSAVEVRPPAPISISDPWDCCYMWIYGDNWGWQPAPNRPRVQVLIEDAAGKRHEIDLGRVDYQYWFLAHRRVMLLGAHKSQSPRLSLPARFAGFRVLDIKREEPSAIYFDNLTFYEEQLKPLKFKERGKLPFPTRRDTILPSVHERCECTAKKQGRGYVFESRGPSAVVR